MPLPILAFTAMPNHWHFVVRPTGDRQVSEFFRRLTVTHTMRWPAHYRTSGSGHLYQGRFTSLPVQADEHLLMVLHRGANLRNWVSTNSKGEGRNVDERNQTATQHGRQRRTIDRSHPSESGVPVRCGVDHSASGERRQGLVKAVGPDLGGARVSADQAGNSPVWSYALCAHW